MRKRFYLYFYAFVFVNQISLANNLQATYKFHEFTELGITMEDAIANCSKVSTLRRYKINVQISRPLPVGSVYKVDLNFGRGVRYYKVTKSFDFPTNDSDKDGISGTLFEDSSEYICDTSYKYHQFADLGSSKVNAIANCSKISTLRRYKINVQISQPLPPGGVYKVDLNFGDGVKYYKVTESFDVATKDSDRDDISGILFEDSEVNICDSNFKYHIIKYRGQTKKDAFLSKCNNDVENSVGINIDQKLSVGTVYYLDRGVGIGPRYYEVTTVNDSSSHAAETDISNDKIESSFVVNCGLDRDNDGIPDSIDSCPNEAGSSSNNGCPFVSLANVEITQLRILRNGSTEIFNSNTNSTPILSYGNSYEFIYTVENSGGRATNLNLSKFFSYNSTFDPYDDFFIEQDESSAIAAGGKITLRTFVNPGYGYIGNASVSNNQGCYFITSLVYENGDDSTSEFESRIGFIYSTNTSSRLASSYRLQSFDFSGNLISTKEVKGKVEEKQFVQSLPQGSYIIKSDLGETYKISKN